MCILIFDLCSTVQYVYDGSTLYLCLCFVADCTLKSNIHLISQRHGFVWPLSLWVALWRPVILAVTSSHLHLRDTFDSRTKLYKSCPVVLCRESLCGVGTNPQGCTLTTTPTATRPAPAPSARTAHGTAAFHITCAKPRTSLKSWTTVPAPTGQKGRRACWVCRTSWRARGYWGGQELFRPSDGGGHQGVCSELLTVLQVSPTCDLSPDWTELWLFRTSRPGSDDLRVLTQPSDLSGHRLLVHFWAERPGS